MRFLFTAGARVMVSRGGIQLLLPCYEIPLNVPLLDTMTQPVSATVTAHLADMSV